MVEGPDPGSTTSSASASGSGRGLGAGEGLAGREPEQARVRALLAAARAGRGGALVVHGEPGVGKTALLAWACREAADFEVLSVHGAEPETGLGFSGLFDLLRPALGRLDDLPAPQAAALRGAFALGPPVAGDRFAVHLASLGLLAAHAERAPLLLVVDDAHWLDPPSREAMRFCARRLGDDPIALLLALRAEEGPPELLQGLPALALAPLEPEPAAALLGRSSGPEPLAPAVAAALLAACAGNPLALVEVPGLLTPAQLLGQDPLPDPLPAGAWLRGAWARRLEALSPAVRAALEVLAVSDTGALRVLAATFRSLGLPLAALEEAEAAALVTIDAGQARFRHPLVRSVIREATPPRRRRRAHRALGAASGGERRAWHLAEAALGPDREAAAALEEVGRRLRERADPVGASRALARAADLSAEPARRVDNLLAAAGQAHLALPPEAALALVERALDAGADALQRADAERLRARIDVWRGDPPGAQRRLVAAAEAVRDRDPGRATTMLADAAMALLMAARTREGIATARRAGEVARAAGAAARGAADAALGWALILRGRWRQGYPLVVASAGGPGDLTGSRDPAILARECAIWVEDWAAAEATLTRLVVETRSAGAAGALAYPLAALADLEFRTGRWGAALAHATEAVQVAEETGQGPGLALAALVRIEAARGDEAACRAHAAVLVEAARRRGFNSLQGYAGAALGLLELGAGRAPEAVAALALIERMTERAGLEEPALVPWEPDHVEARARAGQPAEAAAALRSFAARAQRVGRRWPPAALARCRGLLAPDGDFERHFLEAERLLAEAPLPFERARGWLAHGERLRRARRRREARSRLGAALERFEALGAAPWAERARAELRASGARARGRRQPASGELTPQERTVAQAVAEGASNREVAARLFVSPKTVEGHLGSIYRKLGVRSRTQLARLVIEAGAAG